MRLNLRAESRKRLLYGGGVFFVAALVTLGVFASNGWFPSTDPLSGKRKGWFGKELPKNAPSSWNPLAAPLPNPTPQLSKEYIYAGSRLLAVEDANATAAPPSDLAVWRPSTGQWWVLGGPGSQQTMQTWGVQYDKPVPGDYDGDGKTDFSIFRPSNNQWYLIHSSTGSMAIFPFGVSGDKPAQADYDGDGRTDAAVFRPSDNTWYVQGTGSGYYFSTWGQSADEPSPADYDGDGRADIAVWRPSEQKFYAVGSSNGHWMTPVIGQSGEPVSGDYDGDGKADFAIYQTATESKWYVRKSTTQTVTLHATWGTTNDQAVPNDYDGDGKVDHAIWRPSNGTWYIVNSSNGNIRQTLWGQAGDKPVPALYRR